jgi:hypothetical protein
MKINKNKEEFIFIVIITGKFDNLHRKSFIENLAKYIYPNKVLIINRPIDPFITLIKNRERFSESFFIQSNESNIYVLNPWLFIYDSLLLNLSKSLKNFSFIIFKKQITKVLNTLNVLKLKKIVWVMHPDLIDYLEYLPCDRIIYDCYDEFIVPIAVRNIELREKKLVEKVNLTITISKYLKENKEKLYPEKKIIYSPNAVDTDLFFNSKKFIPDDIKKISKPIIGYVGNVKEEIDLELIKYLAIKMPSISIVFVGQISKDLKQEIWTKLPNIYFLGKKVYSDLPNYIDFFDIGIIPYKVNNSYIKSISPMKLYEYLGLGIYVVSTPVPEVVDFSLTEIGKKNVKVAYNKEEFLENILNFIKLPKKKLLETDINSISWNNRFNSIFKYI